MKYTKRYSHGLTALMNYTFSKSLDDGGSAASGGGSAGNPQTITNLRAGYGASGFDQKHRFVSSVTYELPFGGGREFLRSGILSHIFGGFEFDAITTYASGPPFTVTLNSGVTNASASWPNRLAGRGKIDHGTYLHFFNTSLCAAGLDDGVCAFQVPTGNSYGNSSRSVLYGPSTKNWDVALQRHIKIFRERNIAFKVDAFNVFNTKNLLTPNTSIGSANAGVITGTNRTIAICKPLRPSTSNALPGQHRGGPTARVGSGRAVASFAVVLKPGARPRRDRYQSTSVRLWYRSLGGPDT